MSIAGLNATGPRAWRRLAIVSTVFATPWMTLPAAAAPISQVTYSCAHHKTINAAYYPDRVDLAFSDGRSMTLPQTMSGSGIRYANADESLVFWSKGNTAFVTEGNATTYENCVGQNH